MKISFCEVKNFRWNFKITFINREKSAKFAWNQKWNVKAKQQDFESNRQSTTNESLKNLWNDPNLGGNSVK